jgi:hypothetical protein
LLPNKEEMKISSNTFLSKGKIVLPLLLIKTLLVKFYLCKILMQHHIRHKARRGMPRLHTKNFLPEEGNILSN